MREEVPGGARSSGRGGRRGLVAVVQAAVAVTALSAGGASAQSDGWRQYADPTEAGFSIEGLAAARALAEEFGSGSVMVIQGGHVVAAWGDVEQRWKVYSVRKSLLSLMYGPWVADRTIDLGRRLSEYDLPEPVELTTTEEQATVEAVLSARSGVYLPAARETESAEARRPERGTHPPDAHWYYNNWDFNLAGWIFERETGRGMAEAFTDQLAVPLGLEDWRPEDFFYQREPRRTPIPAYGFRVSTRDLARIGQVVLDGGRWKGVPVVAESWIERSTTSRSDLGGGAGYGYMWWLNGKGWLARDLPTPVMDRVHDIAAVGAQGQLILIVPEWDLVIVHRGDSDHGRAVSDPQMLAVAEAVLAARTGSPEAGADLEPLREEPFPYDEPPVSLPERLPLRESERTAWVGEYTSPDPTFEIYAWEDGLFIATPEGTDLELFGTEDGGLVAEALPIRLTALERDSEGRVVAFRLRMPDGRELPVRRSDAPASGAGDGSGAVPSSAEGRTQGWLGDLRVLTQVLREGHWLYRIAPFPPEFESQRRRIQEGIPGWTDSRVVAEMQRLLATLGDGHTLIYPFGMERGGLARIPLAFYWFADGLGVVSASAEYSGLVGSKVVSIGGVPIEEALAALAPYASSENESQLKWVLPVYAGFVEYLRVAGVPIEGDRVAVTLEGPAGSRSVEVGIEPGPVDPSDMVVGLPAPDLLGAAAPVALSHPDTAYWYTRLPDDPDVVYFQMNRVSDEAGDPLADFSDRLVAEVEARKDSRLVIDLRFNSGGNAAVLTPLLRALIALDVEHPEVPITVLIGRQTFSAAQTLVNRLEEYISPTFIGEPTGSKPNRFGNERGFRLPYSGIVGGVSSGYNQAATSRDDRTATDPDIEVLLTLEDWRVGHDPALAAAVRSGSLSRPDRELRPEA